MSLGIMINAKAKGSKGERDLVRAFNEAGWGCIRIAGSGSSRYPSPDILAGNAIRRLAIECKVTAEDKKYFSAAEVEQLREFSCKFGAEAWFAVKFSLEDWFFFMIEDLEKAGGSLVCSIQLASIRGLRFSELIQR